MAPTKFDILIVGSGSAGLCAGLWLSRCGVRSFKILERRPGPMEIGQADGVQCRTVEVFESFGIAEEILREGFWVREVVFWSESSPEGEGGGNAGEFSEREVNGTGADGGPAGGGGRKGIKRSGRTADIQPGLSHQPHLILNQARVNGLLLERMRRWDPGMEVEYGVEVQGVEVDEGVDVKDAEAYPVTVTTERDGKEEVYKAKYALACDGAHSAVRRSLGYKMVGDSQNEVWGVMDVYPRTDFPDIRKKAKLRSTAGNLLVIPREGERLVRFYIELPHGTSAKDVAKEDLHEAARRIFYPYTMEIADTFWWSAYSVGQRLADHFSKSNRVFLTGDACHTHAPKAGQGMNVSLQDGYNIGWKLAQVIKGQAQPELLYSYNIEREKVARDLIEFDKYFTSLFSSKTGASPEHLDEEFIKSGRYTAGLTATYEDSAITNARDSVQSFAGELKVGMRFPSAQVVRFCDAKEMQFVQALPADGRWRIVIFAGEIGDPAMLERLEQWAGFLEAGMSPVKKITPLDADMDSYVELIVVLAGERVKLEQEEIPKYFWPVNGKWRMRDLHKVFVDDDSYNAGHGRAYEKYGVDPAFGAAVIVRPDQYVSMVVGLEDFARVIMFFHGFAVPQR